MATALLAALGGCGSDPPETRESGREVRTATSSASPDAVPRPAALPTRSPTPIAPPLPKVSPIAAIAPAGVTPATYLPKDECATLPGFAAFRAALLGAVRKRDAVALAALADPAVNLDFGGGSGPDELRKRLTNSPALWGELAALEGLGCAEDGGVVTMPWIFSRLPDSVDAYSAMLVTGEGVPLRAKPAADATELAKLDWALVGSVNAPDSAASRPAAFREVTSGPKAKSSRGFVEAAKLRSVLDYRLIADRQNGDWKITAFVAGD